MSSVERRYSFAPLEQRGVLAGLRSGQVAIGGGALLLAVILLRRAPDAAGVAATLLLLLGSTAAAFVPVSGRCVDQWAPVALRHAGMRLGGGAIGRASARAGSSVVPRPRALRGVRFSEVHVFGGTAVGVVEERSSGCATAIVAVRGTSFALLDGADKDRRLDAWAAVLAGLAREGGPVRSLSWVHRTIPGDAEALGRHLQRRAVVDADQPSHQSYAELVAEAGPVGHDHECLLALTVRPSRRRDPDRRVLLRELRLLEGQLRTAEIDFDHVLCLREIGAVLRTSFDPLARTGIGRRAAVHADLPGPLPESSWPAATDGGWASWRTDDSWHTTFWIAEWPRSEVGADFLGPLLLHAGAQSRTAVVMSPLPHAAGVREAEAARTAQEADDHLRQRAGFLATARRRREAEGIVRRERELSDGHAAYRFAGYVTVTAHAEEALEAAAAEVLQAAHQSRLELRRLFGVQDLAFVWSLPLGLGIASR